MTALPCPCGSGSAYRDCCRPLLRGESRAATATALMRSRYTAYVRRHEAYLLSTWEASHRPEALDLDHTVWLGLEVRATDAGGPDDVAGTVTFVAHYEDGDGVVDAVRECSRFVRDDGAWVYVDGKPSRPSDPVLQARPRNNSLETTA